MACNLKGEHNANHIFLVMYKNDSRWKSLVNHAFDNINYLKQTAKKTILSSSKVHKDIACDGCN
jgi:hypothetical protein